MIPLKPGGGRCRDSTNFAEGIDDNPVFRE
jgi:hypothetical protein